MNILSLIPTPLSSKEFDADNVDGIEWDHNSKYCVLCETPWGTFLNRKHHCRHCKRLVCESCSTKRLVIDNSQVLKRVCDGCNAMLTTKQLFRQEIKIQKGKQEHVLKSASYLSKCLIKVFMLDGSHKVLSFDSNTTVRELTSLICFSVKIALFEVRDNINDPNQYRLVLNTELIDDIIARWESEKLLNAKLVIPVYDFNSTLLSEAPPDFKILKSIQVSSSQSNTTSGCTAYSSTCVGTGTVSIPSSPTSGTCMSPPPSAHPTVASPLFDASNNTAYSTCNGTVSNSNKTTFLGSSLAMGKSLIMRSHQQITSAAVAAKSNSTGDTSSPYPYLFIPIQQQQQHTQQQSISVNDGGFDTGFSTINRNSSGNMDETDMSCVGIRNSFVSSDALNTNIDSNNNNTQYGKLMREYEELRKKYELLKVIQTKAQNNVKTSWTYEMSSGDNGNRRSDSSCDHNYNCNYNSLECADSLDSLCLSDRLNNILLSSIIPPTLHAIALVHTPYSCSSDGYNNNRSFLQQNENNRNTSVSTRESLFSSEFDRLSASSSPRTTTAHSNSRNSYYFSNDSNPTNNNKLHQYLLHRLPPQ